ncbi:MAG TPA: M64 family metallopeptidase [Burkholderiales bacterium]|nr:M64 family metallopeptidase [Burkholderiales bacterium]
MLQHAAAAGLSMLVPACRRTEPEKSAQDTNGVFAEGALRLDWQQRLVAGAESFTLEQLRLERKWHGRERKAADGPDWGDYRLSVYDPNSEALLFRQGFDSSLAPDARAAMTQLSVRFPMPRHPVRAAIEKRRGERAFFTVAKVGIDPDVSDIDRSPGATAMRVDAIFAGGEPGAKVDLAILGDGYREAEYPKFLDDAKRAAGYLFSVEPFNRRKRDFNVSSVFAASADSGVTDPYLGLKKDTVFRCAYGNGGSERSLADGNNQAVREVASAVPYDFLVILANARRYGGSSYFGGPAVVAIDSAAARYLVIHEFAHSIGGLADEYYIPAAGGPSYFGNVEPWHANVTISPEKKKWHDLLTGPGQWPTAWNKVEYEKYFASYVKQYEALRASGAEEAAIEKFMDRERQRQAALLAKNGNQRKVGYYEGANGHAKGMFRAEVDCIMFSLQTRYFCAACSAAIERMIDEHCR